jgi:uncharacterized protein (DUF1499 family)
MTRKVFMGRTSFLEQQLSPSRSVARWHKLAILLLGFLVMTACTSTRPLNLGIQNGRLTSCPASPNCVSSDAAADDTHFIAPYRLQTQAAAGWSRLAKVVSSLPRTTVVSVTEDYLHAECKSLIFRFVDDLEFHLRPDESLIAVRSGSRLGYSDLGVNRRRVEQIRDALRAPKFDSRKFILIFQCFKGAQCDST